MGIYLYNMEMPKERESFTVTIKYNGLVFDTETMIQVAEAQEVPPHGRLVDADKLMQEMRLFIKENMLSRDDARELLETIEDAPDVIPAEEG